MISAAILTLFHSFGLIVFFLGAQGFIFFPLTILYEIWKQRALRRIKPFDGKVSILIPAYNEEKTIRETLLTLLASDYPDIEVIVINDGSTDGTEEAIKDFIGEGIIYIKRPNGGKAGALNRGIEAAKGEVILFTDADSLFLPNTVSQMLRWFGDPSIDAVCGNDTPLDPETPVQKFLTITTHIGTGFVRRALSVIGCLPIITGNLGAIRTSVLREIGGFRETWGEDLEITFRLHKNRRRIIFDPDPKVIAECPGDIASLWKQRIRWMRSYIKIASLHRDLFFNYPWRPFSFYLPINFFNMAVIPLFQMVLMALIPWAFATRHLYFTSAIELMTYLGLIFFVCIAVYSILLDKAFYDFVYLPYGLLLILPFSYFYNAVAVYSWWKEYAKAEERWEKIERRGFAAVRKRGWGMAVVGLLFVLVSSATAYYYLSYLKEKPLRVASVGSHLTTGARPAPHIALSTHFDAWDDWRDALRNVMNRPMIDKVRIVGVGAGRTEWTYFKWEGHQERWSNHQKGAKEDMLLTVAKTFQKSGFKVAAIIDPYAPNLIKDHPEMAATRFDGEKSPDQISFIEMVEGRYGRSLLEMIGYVSRNYPVDIINLTELAYYSYSFNDDDLRSYEAFSGRKGWPRNWGGKIDREDPTIWEWRSTLMERYIMQAADIVHRDGKELYVDVPVSWKDFSRNGQESGLDYRRILKHADKIIVWNYFYLEEASPSVSETLSRYLTENFPVDSFYVSIGLWGKKEHIDPAAFSAALAYTLKGGTPFIWITPDALVTDKHWERLVPYLEEGRR
ncbi:MAG: glycosyltransferase family 2 protein [Nitrospirae bacterium]|nr:glycosyltransferase family 2 protein [Nitrospirota bacterium]